MFNLLSAGLVRLRQSVALWLACAVMAILESGVLLSQYHANAAYGAQYRMEDSFFLYVPLIGIFGAVVCTFHIGPEYGDGTMRNKILIGLSRRDVYLSNLLLSGLASLMLCASAILPGLALGLPLLGGFEIGAPRAALLILGTCLLALAYAALFTLIAMLVPHRAAASTAALLLALGLLFFGSYLMNRLAVQPTLSPIDLTVQGLPAEGAPQPNPEYIPFGPARSFLLFLNDFLPGCQAGQYLNVSVQHPLRLMSYNAFLILLSTAVGLVLFQHKDLQ